MAMVKRAKFTPEQKIAWKEEKIAEQKQMLHDALSSLATSEVWQNWIKFGRSNLRKYSFNNALLIFVQKPDATRVAGKKQWEKQDVTVNADARAIKILAPVIVQVKQDGVVQYGSDGKPMTRVAFYKTVTVYDVNETDAPEVESPDISLEGDEMLDYLAPLEKFAAELGYSVEYRDETGDAHGWLDERSWRIVVNKTLSGNGLVRTLVHELCHAYGNVNYQDYTREDAEVLVESSTVLALGMMGYDTSDASVPYIASWGGDLKVLDKYAKLVDQMVHELTTKMGL
jgi:hypothetical protein